MSAQVGPSSAALLPSSRTATTTSYVQGAIAGLVGAATIALWFFALDVGGGRPLYTPTMLGAALFEGGKSLPDAASMQPSMRFTLMFTVVHGIIFMLIGIAAARLMNMLAERPSLGMAILLLFVVFQLGFVAFAMTFAAVTLDALGMPELVIGNLLAAGALGGYLWWHRPARLAA